MVMKRFEETCALLLALGKNSSHQRLFKNLTAETQSTLREETFAQSGDDDWAKEPAFKSGKFFVCRRLPTNKNLILCALCVSAVNNLRSVKIGVNLR